jgi:hypothetical protein
MILRGGIHDVVRLSPFGHEHINMLGRYSFAVARGELRPLPGTSENPQVGSLFHCSPDPKPAINQFMIMYQDRMPSFN